MSRKLALVLFLFLISTTLFVYLSNFSHQQKLAFAQTSNPHRLQVSSSYYGTVISKPSYNYAPSIMLDDDGLYKMWWCGPDSNDRMKDHIHYVTSEDGFRWENHKIVLGPGGGMEGAHVCDPSVVKVEERYFMYYTSDLTGHPGVDNSIFLATSNDGIHWDKYSTSEPVIECSKKDGSYCAGQSSVFYKDGKFWHYFTNTRGKDGGGGHIYLASSVDGINFKLENNGESVFGDYKSGVEVKYNPKFDLYFMVYGAYGDSFLFWNVSSNGVNWLPHDHARTIETRSIRSNDNSGLLGSPTGMIEEKTITYYGAREDLSKPDIDATTINLSVSTPTFTIQGYKLGCPEGTKIKLDGVEETTAQPYFLHDAPTGTHTVSLELPAGSPLYNISYSPCDCCINHPDESFISGNSHTFIKDTACYYDLYWQCKRKGDFNDDDQVNSQDLKILLENWGETPPNSSADLNSDGLVNGVDFGKMLRLIQ